MKNLFTRFLFLVGLLVYLALLGNRSGAPAGRTGAPGESTCGTSSCHNVTDNAGSATIGLSFGAGAMTYTPGETHTIAISIDGAQNTGRNGFEIVALDAQDANVGTWVLSGDDKRTRSANNRDYVTQTNNGSGQSAWEIDWTAPETDAGKVTFYLAYNDANDNGGRTGDDIYTATLEAEAALVSSVKDLGGVENISVFPNPVKDVLNLRLNLTQEMQLTGTLMNQAGQNVANLFKEKMTTGEAFKSVNIPTGLTTGYYYLKLNDEFGGVKSIPIIKQ